MLLVKMKKKSKKGVSVIIGYVLLVSLAIIMGLLVYNYLKTFVPKDGAECSEGVSIYLKEYYCDSNYLNITLKNNGRFDVSAYFIHASNSSEQKIATINLAENLIHGDVNGIVESQGMLHITYTNPKFINEFESGEEIITQFNLSSLNGLNSIEITPVRYQKIEHRLRAVSCGQAKIKETLICNP